jgi:hypothetical protein
MEQIQLKRHKTSIVGLSAKETNERMEAAWKELREKTLASGRAFLLTDETVELPDGSVMTIEDRALQLAEK